MVLLFGTASCVLVGYTTAEVRGLTVVYYAASMPITKVQLPHSASENTIGIEIKGNALGRHLNGMVAFYKDEKLLPSDANIDVLSAICLADGEPVLIGTYYHSPFRDIWDVMPIDGPPIRNTKIAWAAKITGYNEKLVVED
jgi:hypothetical protein